MTDPFLSAGRIIAASEAHGRLLWAVNGHRCYERSEDGTSTLTLLSPAGPTLVYAVEGVDLDALT